MIEEEKLYINLPQKENKYKTAKIEMISEWQQKKKRIKKKKKMYINKIKTICQIMLDKNSISSKGCFFFRKASILAKVSRISEISKAYFVNGEVFF